MSRNILITCTALSLLCLSGPLAFAEESRLETQAARCAAIFAMLAEAFQENANQAKSFRQFSGLFNELYLKEQKERTGDSGHDAGAARRSLLLREFRETYHERQAGMKEEVVLCGAWAEGYRVQGDNYSYVPIIPKLIPPGVRAEYEALAVTGWQRWIK